MENKYEFLKGAGKGQNSSVGKPVSIAEYRILYEEPRENCKSRGLYPQ